MSNLCNPRIKSDEELRSYMFDVEIALIPAIVYGVYQFGYAALQVIIASVLSCVLTEVIYKTIIKKPVRVWNGSSIITGILLALILPPAVPLYVPILGGIFATFVVVELFGGYGQNFINPALSARGFLLISFTLTMTNYAVDGMTGATPLAVLSEGGSVALNDLLIGSITGCIGEVSAIAILIGAVYLIIRRRISFIIPVIYIAVFALYMGLFGGHGFDVNYLGTQVLGGGLLFAAVFFATDYVTSPLDIKGQLLYAVILGIVTGIYRHIGSTTESVSYAVMFCSLFVPLIDKAFTSKKSTGMEAA